MTEPPFLSIIVPFHNSAAHCAPLLRTLADVKAEDGVELIFVDDGSTDSTLEILNAFARSAATDVQIIERDNGGPGAARNLGFERSSGRHVWFVDSDDNIDLGVLAVAKSAEWPDVDLVAWEWDHPNIARKLAPGLYDTLSAPAPTDALDPIVANWFSRDFLKRTGLRFPEYCIFEATPLEAFVLPLLAARYVKSDFCAYLGNAETASVTRGNRRQNPRFYDRLATVSLGMNYVREAEVPTATMADFRAAFVRLFLWYSVPLSKIPGGSWLRAARVMRMFRDEARRFGVRDDPFAHYPGRRPSELVMRLLWALSAGLPPQNGYFERMRNRAWRTPLRWQPPELPARWRPMARD